jgi:hypothetical protein
LNEIKGDPYYDRKDPLIVDLLSKSNEVRPEEEKTELKGKLLREFPYLHPEELDLLVDAYSIGHGLEGVGTDGFQAFSEEDLLWVQQLMSIHNHALGKDSLKDKWGGAPKLSNDKEDQAMRAKGGIDLTPANMNLQTKTGIASPFGIKFQLDPAMLEQLQNAPGFVPVIISVQPLKDLSVFLGLNQK